MIFDGIQHQNYRVFQTYGPVPDAVLSRSQPKGQGLAGRHPEGRFPKSSSNTTGSVHKHGVLPVEQNVAQYFTGERFLRYAASVPLLRICSSTNTGNRVFGCTNALKTVLLWGCRMLRLFCKFMVQHGIQIEHFTQGLRIKHTDQMAGQKQYSLSPRGLSRHGNKKGKKTPSPQRKP